MPALTLDQRYTAGLLLLTVSTGAIDAVSYLALDRVFTGNMTGNVLFLGFALVGVAGIPLLNNAVALFGFVVGSIVSGRIIGRGHEKGLPATSVWTLVVAAAVIAGLGVTTLLIGELAEPALLVITFLLATTMGAQVSAVKPIGNSDVTTIVVTNTVANLARDSRLGGGRGQSWMPRLLAIVAMGLGAALGAGVVNLLGGGAALVASALVFSAGATVLVAARRHSATSRQG